MKENLIFLILGWLGGLFSPLIVDEIRKVVNRAEVHLAIKKELDELRLKLICHIHLATLSLGTLDRELCNFMIPIVKKYKGAHEIEAVSKGIDVLSGLDDTHFTAYVASQASPQTGKSLKKYSLPYLESKIDQLGLFPEQMQGTLLSIKAHLELVNQEIDLARFYMEKTFDSSVDAPNRAIIDSNLRGRYIAAAEGARTLVDLINKVDGM